MKYILANNATASLASGITDADTSIELFGISTTLSTALGLIDASNRVLLTLADASETDHEIVEVTAWDSATSTATVTRGQDDTTAQAWGDGSKAEIRVGKKQLDERFGVSGNAANTVLISPDRSAGKDTDADGPNNTFIGNNFTLVPGNHYSVVAGESWAASSPLSFCTSIGCQTELANEDFSSEDCYGAVAVGCLSMVYGNECTGVGTEVHAKGVDCVSIGYATSASGVKGITAIGAKSVINSWPRSQDDLSFTTALGYKSICDRSCSIHIAGIPIQNKTSYLPWLETDDIASRHRSAPITTLATGIIDLTDDTATAQIELPAGTHFFPDRIDVIITGVDTPGGSPEITVGTTTAGTDILAATVITKDTAHQRQKISPDSDDGVDDIHISVSTAGSGTTYSCRVVVSGYLVEDE